MIKLIFALVAMSLFWTSKKINLSYNELNIIAYYLLIPLSWTIMFDFWIGYPLATIAIALIWTSILLAVRHSFSEWCDRVFLKSVCFLKWFNRWGSNYVLSSVIICVVIPLLIYGYLAWLLITSH